MTTPLSHLLVGIVAFAVLLMLSRWAGRQVGAGEDNQTGVDPNSRWIGKERIQVIEIVDETHDIKTFRFRRNGDKNFPPFRAGQFLTFQIGEDPKQVRSYSIASVAGLAEPTIDVAVKKLDGGLGSQWFHERKAGDWIYAYGPSGRFTDLSEEPHPRVYIAGGIGITPILSMIRARLAKQLPGNLTLIYAVRTPQDLAFDSLLQEWAKKHGYFKYISHFGLLTYDLIRQHAAIDEKSIFFICGPTEMNETITRELLASGISDERIHDEKFVSKTLLDPTKITDREAKIHISKQTYIYSGREPLLDFLEDHGIEVPSACRTGVCGSCKCIVRGEFESLTDTGLSRAEKQLGYTLTCVTYPKNQGDVEIVLPHRT